MDDDFPSIISDSIRRILLRLAKEQDELAADTAAATPYWIPCPPTVLGHRAAASALRNHASRFLPTGTGNLR